MVNTTSQAARGRVGLAHVVPSLALDQRGAVAGERLGLAARAVPHAHAVAGGEQPLDHGLAHAAEADPSDAIRHSCVVLLRVKIQLAMARCQ
jgi:hypothetical protein